MDNLLIILPVVLCSVALGMAYALYRFMRKCTQCRLEQETKFEHEVEDIVNTMTVKEFLTRIGRDAGY